MFGTRALDDSLGFCSMFSQTDPAIGVLRSARVHLSQGAGFHSVGALPVQPFRRSQ
ncbi:hypothetical protein MES4922_140035 [Mesorhizobium ventifaucium]|uniref:Uncharacterized protein n=1 Tax=Mesorhizobium ventifaucium TaxID=666020 RepID=A0ABN8JCT1_9HYPH|nr:hypothetical protein MES4922_140035 [Mesorhizobium ventifaucium]